MRRFLPDTSCIVAVVSGWHEKHAPAIAALESRLEAGERMSVAAHSLMECYAVLTRLPPPHRLSPVDALALLHPGFTTASGVVALDEKDYLALLRRAPGDDIAGGRTYDAVIAACAIKARADTILTFNADDFEWVEALGLGVEVPGV